MAMALRFYPLQLSSLQYRFETSFIRDHQCAGFLIKDSDDVFPCAYQMPVCYFDMLPLERPQKTKGKSPKSVNSSTHPLHFELKK